MELKATFFSSNLYVDPKQRHIVFGYVRATQQSFPKLQIPPLIAHLVFYFYHQDVFECFEQMYLRTELLRSVYEYGFEKPSTTQQRAIVPLIQKHNMLVQAHSGTGKTSTYLIAALQRVDVEESQCQTLILAPTRELAQGIRAMLAALGKPLNVTSRACVGGVAVREDIKALTGGIQMVVGTPGRVNDMIQRAVFNLERLHLFVLDEVDEMLSRGFSEQIGDCFQNIPAAAQIVMLSATLPNEVEQLIECFMRQPLMQLTGDQC